MTRSYNKNSSGKWQNLIDNFGTEIDILINASIEEIAKTDPSISPAIEAFRNKTIHITPGGGGKYGEISLIKKIRKREAETLTTLDNF